MQTALAKTTATDTKQQFCTFGVAGRLYGVDILHVKEINSQTEFTPVFHAPPEVRGYVNIRGQVHLILDLRLLLGFESTEANEASRVVLFKSEVGESFGVLVDSIGDVVEVDVDQIEDRPDAAQLTQGDSEQVSLHVALIEGVCWLKGELLVVLNATRFLNVIEM